MNFTVLAEGGADEADGVGAVALGYQSDNTSVKRGAVIGAATGATAGAIIGHQSGRPLKGTGIGAGAGVVGGALWGSSMDR